MPLPNPLRINHRTFTVYTPDVGLTVGSMFTSPTRGRIASVTFTPHAVVTGTSNLSVKVATVAVTGMTAAATGAAGLTFTLADPTNAALAVVQQGDLIELASDGGASSVSPGTWVVVIREF